MNKIEIEFYPAGKDIFLVLTGIGGTVKGYQNRYEKIAKEITDKYNFSIVIATTPHGSWEHPKENLDFIFDFIRSKRNDTNFKIYAMGHSAGGTFLLWHAFEFPEIEKILCINPVLNINLHKTQIGIESYKGSEINIVVGELDASNYFAGLIDKLSKVKVYHLPNIDHNFTNALDTFIDLPHKYLFN